MYGAKTYEVWICGRWEGADWDLANHSKTYGDAKRRAIEWTEKGFKAAVFDSGRHILEIIPHD